MKRFNIMYNIGKAKYVVNYADGTMIHPDGSDFFAIKIFSNKKDLAAFIKELKNNGYVERSR